MKSIFRGSRREKSKGEASTPEGSRPTSATSLKTTPTSSRSPLKSLVKSLKFPTSPDSAPTSPELAQTSPELIITPSEPPPNSPSHVLPLVNTVVPLSHTNESPNAATTTLTLPSLTPLSVSNPVLVLSSTPPVPTSTLSNSSMSCASQHESNHEPSTEFSSNSFISSPDLQPIETSSPSPIPSQEFESPAILDQISQSSPTSLQDLKLSVSQSSAITPQDFKLSVSQSSPISSSVLSPIQLSSKSLPIVPMVYQLNQSLNLPIPSSAQTSPTTGSVRTLISPPPPVSRETPAVTVTPSETSLPMLVEMPQVPISPATTPLPQRLFFRPGAIEEQDDEASGADSPLIFKQSHYTQYNIVGPMTPMTPGLNRISTCNSSLTHFNVRQDSRSRFRPGATRKTRRRAILKNGDCNILQSRISKHRLRFLQDIFTTLVDTQWRWTLIVFALSFLLSWLGFAVIWWLISFTHGDFEPSHLPPLQEENSWAPCVSNIFDFTSCFLFSIETQHTIGYGFRTTSEECPEAIFVMCMQSICGVMIQAFMVGIVFAKMTRPKHRTQTLLFSRNAVICQRDGYLCLMFRVGDMRKSHIIGASIRAQLIRPKTTKEGEILSNYQTELAVNADGCDGDLFFIWPMTIVHRIDEDSPLYSLSAADMLQDRLEIVVILEGTIESTGQTTQARSSYLAAEVLWGHRFEPVVAYNKDRQGYEVKYSKFDNTLQVDTPLCSGAELAEFYRMQEPSDGVDSLQRLNSDLPTADITPA